MTPPRTLGVIPARLASTRLPRKVLRMLQGRPMLAWVYDAARACPQLDEVLIATDSEEVEALCHAEGWPVMMTSGELASGSDRVEAVARVHPAGIYVNIQGDEPLLLPGHLSALLAPFDGEAAGSIQVTTLRIRAKQEDLSDPNVVKVVCDLAGRALYFSRSAIPFDRDGTNAADVWKHMGLYAYRREALRLFHRLPPGALEQTERLEQLRLLENGIPLHVVTTEHDTVGVDTEEDLVRAESMLRARFTAG